MMRMFRRFQPVSIVLFVILLAFLVGFVVFGEKVTSMQPRLSTSLLMPSSF